jgi:hypothetical protein
MRKYEQAKANADKAAARRPQYPPRSSGNRIVGGIQGGNTPPTPQSEIQSSVSVLQNKTASLRDAVRELENRLASVLIPTDAVQGSQGKEAQRGYSSDLATAIASEAQSIEDSQSVLVDLITRLAL